jgi:hypothetical protein
MEIVGSIWSRGKDSMDRGAVHDQPALPQSDASENPKLWIRTGKSVRLDIGVTRPQSESSPPPITCRKFHFLGAAWISRCLRLHPSTVTSIEQPFLGKGLSSPCDGTASSSTSEEGAEVFPLGGPSATPQYPPSTGAKSPQIRKDHQDIRAKAPPKRAGLVGCAQI